MYVKLFSELGDRKSLFLLILFLLKDWYPFMLWVFLWLLRKLKLGFCAFTVISHIPSCLIFNLLPNSPYLAIIMSALAFTVNGFRLYCTCIFMIRYFKLHWGMVVYKCITMYVDMCVCVLYVIYIIINCHKKHIFITKKTLATI